MEKWETAGKIIKDLVERSIPSFFSLECDAHVLHLPPTTKSEGTTFTCHSPDWSLTFFLSP